MSFSPQPTTLQVVLFFRPDTPVHAASLADALQGIVQQKLPFEPAVIPVPSGAPSDIPRVVFGGQPGGFFSVSPSRADLALAYGQVGDDVDGFQAWLASLISVLRSHPISICRIGVVITFAMAGMTLEDVREQYLRDGRLVSASDVLLAWLTTDYQDGVPRNRWVRYALDGQTVSVVLDTNSDPDYDLNLQPTEMAGLVGRWVEEGRGGLRDIVGWLA